MLECGLYGDVFMGRVGLGCNLWVLIDAFGVLGCDGVSGSDGVLGCDCWVSLVDSYLLSGVLIVWYWCGCYFLAMFYFILSWWLDWQHIDVIAHGIEVSCMYVCWYFLVQIMLIEYMCTQSEDVVDMLVSTCCGLVHHLIIINTIIL